MLEEGGLWLQSERNLPSDLYSPDLQEDTVDLSGAVQQFKVFCFELSAIPRWVSKFTGVSLWHFEEPLSVYVSVTGYRSSILRRHFEFGLKASL